nr:RNA-directed DNA polymerase, eukaryota [Tanacetum cinerariifolium]
MGSRNMSSFQSKFDQTAKISKSVFVSNFPDGCNHKDLWKVCNDFGNVVDVFIPNKKSKSGKRFAFVRFIMVRNLERLIKNLNTIWIGRFHLIANPARYERPNAPLKQNGYTHVPKHNVEAEYKVSKGTGQTNGHGLPGSYANVVNGQTPVGVYGPSISLRPTMLLDDSCTMERDWSNNFMGQVKDITLISNLKSLIKDEGFSIVNLMYLGGMWVMIECENVESKAKMMQHTGVRSWFNVIQNVISDFFSDERIVWVDIKGIPLNIWSRETFVKIGNKWGEVMDIEDNVEYSFGRKRICIKTKQHLSILETFKVFSVRAKELFTWTPVISVQKEGEDVSDDEVEVESKHDYGRPQDSREVFSDGNVSDDEVVSDTVFGDNSPIPPNHSAETGKPQSEDPFRIYDILNKQPRAEPQEVNSSLSHPSGFTPVVQPDDEVPVKVNANVMNNSHDASKGDSGFIDGSNVVRTGGSVLEVMEDLIRVGKAMGFMMDGCEKDLEKIIGSQGDGEANGYSGGIICVWESTVFKKENATILDNFVAVYGTWLPTNSKILFVVVYAPQWLTCRRLLWDYVSTLIDRWNGEVVVLGDFNEVRVKEERRGSCFNPTNARAFDQFITSSGLVDVKMKGYEFTWIYPSGSKMSKLDRFLVSEGIYSVFPSITAMCIEKHLSDHRSIVLREVQANFGPIPFRFYHLWFSLEGFDDMVEQTWGSSLHCDSNKMIRFKKKLQDLKIKIRSWVRDKKSCINSDKDLITNELADIDKLVDCGIGSDSIHLRRSELQQNLFNINQMKSKELFQKSKVKWAIEGDENSKFFHGLINKKHSQLAIRGVFIEGVWCTNPSTIKEVFYNHFEARFKQTCNHRLLINFPFKKRLSATQADDLERCVARDEIKSAVWSCGTNKSPGPEGFSFEFFRKYWSFIGHDLCEAV